MNNDDFEKQSDDINSPIEYIIEDDMKPMSLIQRVVNVFLSPGKLMENLNKYPKMLAPIVVFLIAGIATAFIYPQITKITLENQSLMMVERYGVDILSVGTSALNDIGGIVSIATAAGALIGALTGPYISGFFSAVLLLVLSAIFRVKSKFTQYYSMYIHIAIVTCVLSVISTFFMVVTNSIVDVLSLGMLIPNGDILNPVFMAFNTVSVSNIWTAVLVCIGLKTFTGTSTTKAAIISGICFVLMIAYSAGTALAMGYYYDFLYNMLGNSISF